MESLEVNKKVLGLLLLGFLIICLFLFFFKIDIPKIIEVISSADPFLLFLALISVLSGLFFYALTWDVILRAISEPLGIWKAFQYVCTSIFLAFIFPVGTLTGETSRAYLTVKNSNNDAGSAIASIISHRSMDMIPFLGGACIGFIFMIMSRQFYGYVIYAVSFVIFFIILIISFVLYLSFRPEKTEGILNFILRLFTRLYKRPEKLSSWREKAFEQLRLFHEGIERLRVRSSTLVLALLTSALSYTFDILATKIVFNALGTDVPFSIIITVYTIAIAIQTIPVGLPGGTGPIEVTMIAIYLAAGIPPTTGSAATLIIRGIDLWFEVALGGVMTYWVGIKTLKGTS